MGSPLKIETVAVPLHPALVDAMERELCRLDDALVLVERAQAGEPLTEAGRAKVEAAERELERRLFFGEE
jgi:exonuclease VII small subunit